MLCFFFLRLFSYKVIHLTRCSNIQLCWSANTTFSALKLVSGTVLIGTLYIYVFLSLAFSMKKYRVRYAISLLYYIARPSC